MKSKIGKYLTLAVTAFAVASPVHAAYDTVVKGKADTYELLAGAILTRYEAEANSCYDALDSVSIPAANAGYYNYLREAYSGYYYNLAGAATYEYLALAWADIANLASYLEIAKAYQDAYYDIAGDYNAAYAGYDDVFDWSGGDYGDEVELNEYELANDYALIGDCYADAYAPQDGYYLYAVVYEGVAQSMSDFYDALADLIYAIYADAGMFPQAQSESQVWRDQGSAEANEYYVTSLYYEHLAIAFDE